MTPTEVRAVVLAAGLGQRLRPLTDRVPKPLLPVGDQTVVERTLERLATAGVSAIALNLHHHADSIRQHLGNDFAGVPLIWSREPQLLGTLGALTNLREFLRPASLVVVINGDSLCAWPVVEAIELHETHQPLATMLFSSQADPARFGGGVALQGDSRGGLQVAGFGAADLGEKKVFAGLQVFSPDLLEGIPVEALNTVTDLYRPALGSGATLSALVTDRPWFDLGTPARYLDALLATCADETGNTISSRANVDSATEVTRSAVLAGARVAAGARLDRVLVGPGAAIACDSVYESVMLNPQESSGSLPAGHRLEYGLVVSPLGDV